MRMLLVLAVTLGLAAAASGAITQVKAIPYPSSLAAIGSTDQLTMSALVWLGSRAMLALCVQTARELEPRRNVATAGL